MGNFSLIQTISESSQKSPQNYLKIIFETLQYFIIKTIARQK